MNKKSVSTKLEKVFLKVKESKIAVIGKEGFKKHPMITGSLGLVVSGLITFFFYNPLTPMLGLASISLGIIEKLGQKMEHVRKLTDSLLVENNDVIRIKLKSIKEKDVKLIAEELESRMKDIKSDFSEEVLDKNKDIKKVSLKAKRAEIQNIKNLLVIINEDYPLLNSLI